LVDSDVDESGVSEGAVALGAVVDVDCYAGTRDLNYGAIEGILVMGDTDTYYFHIHDGGYAAKHLQLHMTDGWNTGSTLTAKVTYKSKTYTFSARSPKAINIDGPVKNSDVIQVDISMNTSGAYWIFWGLHNEG
jgi:hypothetical protein